MSRERRGLKVSGVYSPSVDAGGGMLGFWEVLDIVPFVVIRLVLVMCVGVGWIVVISVRRQDVAGGDEAANSVGVLSTSTVDRKDPQALASCQHSTSAICLI